MAAAMVFGTVCVASAEENISVGCVVKAKHEYYDKVIRGAQDACDEYGWEFTGMSPSSFDDIDGQVSMVEDMVTAGVNVLLVSPN
ncbi:MAG: substrate-binding domain-containing protein [Blautia sp.]|nr:substrate-binding domain-containing protein [Blautia sp.]